MPTGGGNGTGQLTVPNVRPARFYDAVNLSESITPSSAFYSRTMQLTPTTSAVHNTLSGVTSFTRSSLVSISAFPDMSESNSELEMSLNNFQSQKLEPAHSSFSALSFTVEKELVHQKGSTHSAKSEYSKSDQELVSTKLLAKDLPQMAETVTRKPSLKAKNGESIQVPAKPGESMQDPKITAKSSFSNPSLRELVVERKKSSHKLVSDEFRQVEEEAFRRKRAQESELQQMLQTRRKVVDGDTSSPGPSTSPQEAELPPIARQHSQVRLMASKWEQGLHGKEEEPGPSFPLSPTASEHSQVQLMKAKWEQGPSEEALPAVIVSPVTSDHIQVQKTKSHLEQGLAGDRDISPSHSAPFALSTVTTTAPTLTTTTKTVVAVSTPQPTPQLLLSDEMERKMLRESLARESRKILIKRPSLLSDDSEGASLSSSSEVQ